MGRPAWMLMDGWLLWLSGRQDRAVGRWEACAAEATVLGTRLELARAQLEIARRRPDAPGAAELEQQARRLLDELAASADPTLDV